MSDIKLYLTTLLALKSIDELHLRYTDDQINALLEEQKRKYDWSQNPLIGVRKK